MVGRNKKNGFTLVEALFSLSICLLIVFSITAILTLLRGKNSMQKIDANTEIGMKSLSQDLYTASDFMYGETLQYTDENGQINKIYLHNKRIVREPGFVIYMHDIESLRFYAIDEKIYASILKEKQEKIFLIGTDLLRNLNE